MPIHASVIYIYEKYQHETRWETYIADMLWAPANGKKYENYKRYSESNAPKAKTTEKSGDGILAEILGKFKSHLA